VRTSVLQLAAGISSQRRHNLVEEQLVCLNVDPEGAVPRCALNSAGDFASWAHDRFHTGQFFADECRERTAPSNHVVGRILARFLNESAILAFGNRTQGSGLSTLSDTIQSCER